MKHTLDSPDRDQAKEDRFEFGRNWSGFLSTLDEPRIASAQRSLQVLLQTESLQQRRFLDAGSGSGLFSLAANRLGADVSSFDVDADSVACTRSLKDRFRHDATNWNVFQGSLTDRDFLSTLGKFDVIYCWGVAHHTGSMWCAMENLLPLVKPGGSMVLAIYNDQLYISRIWRGVKRIYQRLPRSIGPLYVASIGVSIFLKRLAITLLACCLRLFSFRNPCIPFANWGSEIQSRGMHGWYDLVDWVGGWPFEVAKVEEVFRFMRDRGFSLQELTTSSGHGCNEYVFIRTNNNPSQPSADLE